jgi:glucose-1-phosphate adenylyltransferase
MELTYVSPQLDLYDSQWPIYTASAQLPPAKFVFDQPGRRGEAIESMVSAGCIISGASVRKSLIFSNCKLHSQSIVEQTVMLPDSEVMKNARIRNAIIDRGSVIPDGMRIGFDVEEDRARGFRVTEGGRTLVTAEMLGQKLHHTR